VVKRPAEHGSTWRPAEQGSTWRPAEQGFALLTSLFVLLLLSLVLALLAASLHLRLRMVHQESETLTLAALSDAALAEAVAHLAANSSFRGLDEHPYGGGALESRVEFLGPHRYRVTARATHAGRARAVEAQVLRAPGLLRIWQWRPVAESPRAAP
jgi:hypothetical protein